MGDGRERGWLRRGSPSASGLVSAIEAQGRPPRTGTSYSAKRCVGMPTFRIFYFRHNVLDEAEEVEVRDVLGAIEKAAGKPPDVRAEIWSDKGRVGIIGPSPTAAHR